ncbi:hypothetical protein N7495_009844 [Penicillium taxi]|uniref:uncharacterized protein n=1 Tax=Penicillium taxi TaxID=168475 RepID=UPI0025451FD1|nr:uncharacterized protein N7495_009844 [Penicillium taxi]KAJ5885334.1 hypothetical protein N7495_009844 [Penicillium taxi]
MLITPRTYFASQTPDQGAAVSRKEGASHFHTLTGWRQNTVDREPAVDMLLIHQVGSVRVGDVVRYTVTYTPASDPILPIPSELHVRVKNTSAIPLRAAYLHGPYTLYAACYPSKFDPNSKYDRQETDGAPQFEPYLKAGGNWDATIKMPTCFGDSHSLAAGQVGPNGDLSMTWVIEIVSQVVFSSSAAVHFELLVARDAKSLNFFSSNGSSTEMGPPAKVSDHWTPETQGQQVLATNGVYSKSITLHVDDTSSLWNSPALPSKTHTTDNLPNAQANSRGSTAEPQSVGDETKLPPKKQQKERIHLVVITHGLHSNLGADMLYLKESIDAAAKKLKEQTKSRESNDADEQIIVRGFSGNAVRTERGIQYLGKRLAKYILLMTYPDQPYFPLKGSKSKFPRPFSPRNEQLRSSLDPLSSSAQGEHGDEYVEDHAYEITSISFIGHSLGGLVQTYAIAYIQKHSPQFFDHIQPINFIALATPFWASATKTPFGRTGQDLGLSWTAPKVRSGWGAIIGGRGDPSKDQSNVEPGTKPLLRILPCGPAHEVLQKFHHRTVYSNVVNDGIVPLRTSSLLFLDWRGLDRVEKARRDNGIVGTMAEWGWAELTGANSKSPRLNRSEITDLGTGEQALQEQADLALEEPTSPSPAQFLAHSRHSSHQTSNTAETRSNENVPGSNTSPGALSTFLSLFRPKETKKSPNSKHARIYKRSQTLSSFDDNGTIKPAVRGNSLFEEEGGVYTPPKTTFFESAGDLLMPPLPPTDFILDPTARPRTIFHDRIYHPEDIPPPLPVKRRTLAFGPLQNKHSKVAPATATPLPTSSGSNSTLNSNVNGAQSGLKVEEKIARAYHRDLTWRKVLVRLEPDAHNNIIVRRMFTNAYGWPVVKHLVDAHFSHSPTVEIDDVFKGNAERAKSLGIAPTSSGDEIEGEADIEERDSNKSEWTVSDPTASSSKPISHTYTEHLEDESYEVASINGKSRSPGVSRESSVQWTDRELDEDDDCESGLDEEGEDAGFRWSTAPRP